MSRALLALVVVAPAAHAEPRLPASDERLDNGLRVVLAPDASVGSVAVELHFAVGAADEAAAQAGFAHLAERLAFAGTPRVGDFDARIAATGGWTTSATTVDHTSFVDHVPAGALALALWLEADRLSSLPRAIDGAKLAAATAAIAAERRAAYEDQPYALVARAVQQALWPDEPNGHLVLGDATATRDAVLAFARSYFVPANATLVIAGQFDPTRARELVQRYFAAIPGGSRNHVVRRPPSRMKTSRQLEVADAVPKVVVAFRTETPWSPDELALDIASRIVVMRATRRLAGKVSDLHAETIRQVSGGEIRIWATLATDEDPREIAAAIRDELERLQIEPVGAAELEQAKLAYELELVSSLESLTFRAELLAAWATYTGTPRYLDRLRSALHAVAPERVHTAALLAFSPVITVIGR